LIGKNDDVQAEIKINEGVYYIGQTNFKPAEKPLSQVIDDSKVSANLAYKALYWRGTYYVKDNKFDNAERDFLLALNTPDMKLKNQTRLKLGSLYFAKEDYTNALDNYYQVINNDDDGKLARDAAYNFAVTSRYMQAWGQAMSAYRVIIDRWGQSVLSAETRLTIGFCFYMAKEYDQAINLFTQLLTEMTNVDNKAEAQYWIAASYAQKGEYETAEENYRTLRANYRSAGRWMDLAELGIAETFISRGDIETGKQLLNQIIRNRGATSDAGKEANKILQTL
jgi:tetratricopeptide (TPR) repeat protein